MDRRPTDPINPFAVTVESRAEADWMVARCPSASRPRLAVRMADGAHTAQVVGLCVLLMFGPIAFGAVESWSFFALQAGAAALFLLWTIEQVLRERIEIALNALYLPMLGFGFWIVAQLSFRIPAYRYPAVNGTLSCVAFALLFFVTVQCCRSTDNLLRIAKLLAIFGFVLALFAIVQGFTSHGELYWVRKPSEGGWVYGPYVNHANYAGLMEMLAPIGVVVGLSPQLHGGKKLLCIFAGAIMGASIFLSQSRGGIVAFVLELAFLGICVFAERRGKRFILGLGTFVVFVVAFTVWLGGGGLLQRMENMQDTTRLAIARDSLRMFAAKPVVGWGLGSFEHVFPQHRTFYTDKIIDHAHNDYLEVLAETGLPGAACILLFIILLYRKGLRATSTWDCSYRAAIRLAALVGCTGMLVHSLTDFNMHIPANAAMFLVLTAIASSNPQTGHSIARHSGAMNTASTRCSVSTGGRP